MSLAKSVRTLNSPPDLRILESGGEHPNPRLDPGFTSAVAAAISGRMRLCHFTQPRTETISSVEVRVGGTAAAATPTLIRFGLYSIDHANEFGTLVASTANDTTLLATINTAYTKALSAPVSLTEGRRYAHAILIVTAAALPTLFGVDPTSTTAIDVMFGLRPRIAGAIDAQTDLPASFVVAGTVANERRRNYMRLIV